MTELAWLAAPLAVTAIVVTAMLTVARIRRDPYPEVSARQRWLSGLAAGYDPAADPIGPTPPAVVCVCHPTVSSADVACIEFVDA